MKRLYALALTAAMAVGVNAQEAPQPIDGWYFGIGAGFHSSYLKFSDLDHDLYPDKGHLGSGVVSLYAQRFFGAERLFSIRPEVAFLNRGGRIGNIYRNLNDYYATDNVEDIHYRQSSHYIDLRLPLICSFGSASATWRPYIFMAPVLGFATGGSMKLTSIKDDPLTTGSREVDENTISAGSRNQAVCYGAAAIGAGVNYYLDIAGHHVQLGLEANYECGLSNTFGSDRTLGANNLYVGGTSYAFDHAATRIRGTRSFDAYEIKATVGIPLSLITSRGRRKAPAAEAYGAPTEESAYISAVLDDLLDDNPCYTLDQIVGMIMRGESPEGKTICAIDDAINFEFSKSEISPESFDYLNRLAQVLKRTNSKVRITGHTDNTGAQEFNLALSKARAISVLDYLVEQGVPRSNLTYDYKGMSSPISTNETETGRRLNRRVEFEILD